MNLKTVVVTGLLLVSAQISQVVAGVEPSPFQPEINQLGAVANILNSAEFRIVKTMSAPPEACVPPDPCKGLYGDINRLEAINGQVYSAHYMIISMIEEVMGVEPSPFRGDLVAPLEVVRDVAYGIVEGIAEKIGEYRQVNVADEFIQALNLVVSSAGDLVETADKGIEQLSQPMVCGDIHDENDCNDFPGCQWTMPAPGAAYLCTEFGF
jgi:hypothetical protein